MRITDEMIEYIPKVEEIAVNMNGHIVEKIYIRERLKWFKEGDAIHIKSNDGLQGYIMITYATAISYGNKILRLWFGKLKNTKYAERNGETIVRNKNEDNTES